MRRTHSRRQLPTPIPPTTTPAPSAHQDPHSRPRMQIINQSHKKTRTTRPPANSTIQGNTDAIESRSLTVDHWKRILTGPAQAVLERDPGTIQNNISDFNLASQEQSKS